MSGDAVELAVALVRAAGVEQAWVEQRAEALAPGVTEALREVTSVVGTPAGVEDLACVAADSPILPGLAELPPPAPLVLLLGAPGEAEQLAGAVRALAMTIDELCVSEPSEIAGVRVLAPLTRVLAAPALPLEWRGARAELAPGDAEADRPAVGEAALDALWQEAVADRQSFIALERAVAAERAALLAARRAQNRAGAETARQAATHRHELAALQRTLESERAWTAEQAQRIGDSRAWRLGHGATRLAWLLTGRRIRAGDLPARIVARMQDPGRR